MKLEIHCPHCDLRLAVSDQHAGKLMSCANCGGKLVVPSAGGAPARSPTNAAQRTPSQVIPRQRGTRDGGGGGRKRSRGPSPVFYVFFVLGTIGAITGVIWLLAKNKDPIFEPPPPPPPPTCTAEEAERLIAGDAETEKRIKVVVRNLWRHDHGSPLKPGDLKINLSAEEGYVSYMTKAITIACHEFDQGTAAQIAQRVFDRWEKEELRELQFEASSTGAADTANPAKPPSAIEVSQKNIAAKAKEAVAAMLEGVTPPEAYAERAQWLRDELIALRKAARGSGLGVDTFAEHAVKVEELYERFDSWAKPEERAKESFTWAREVTNATRELRQRWQQWSRDPKAKLDENKIVQSLTDLSDRLEVADSIFNER